MTAITTRPTVLTAGTGGSSGKTMRVQASVRRPPPIPGLNTIAGWMKANKLPFGAPLTIYHNESFAQENIDTECAFIIPGIKTDKVPDPVSPIVVRQMEAIPQAATTIVAEDFYQKVNGLTPAYNAIGRWIEEHGYRIVGAPRELYYGSPEAGDFTAEIQFPVEKA